MPDRSDERGLTSARFPQRGPEAMVSAPYAVDASFADLADSVKDVFFTLDEDLKYTYWNKAAEALSGIPAAQMVGKAVGEFFSQQRQRQETDKVYREVLRSQQSRTLTTRMKVCGEDRLLEVTAWPWKDGVSVLARDITEQRRNQEELRKSEEKFAKAFRSGPDAVVLATIKESRCVEVNDTFERVTGYRREEAVGRTIVELGLLEEPARLAELVDALMARGSLREVECRFRMRSGEIRIALLSAELIEIGGELCSMSVLSDITERKLAERELRESEERFRILADSGAVMMWMSDTDKACTYFNRPWLEFTGRSLQQELGDGWADGVHPDDLQRCLATYGKAFDERLPFTMEYRLRRNDGVYRWIRDAGTARFLPDGSFAGYIGCCIDIHDQKEAEMTRRELAGRLISAQEAERARIARELHDSIGQSIALLGIQMQRAGRPVPGAPGQTYPGINELYPKLKEIGNQISHLSHQLHSSELEFLGLCVAVKGFCREFSEQYHIKVDCVCKDVPVQIDPNVALSFLRVVQEALHNVAKHSGASNVKVEVAATASEMSLLVSDDGAGFDVDKARSTAGLGLISMRERMHLAGGEFEISSTPGSGTTIRAHAPLTAPAK